jgi:cell cycle checkpoint control protein RAD9A
LYIRVCFDLSFSLYRCSCLSQSLLSIFRARAASGDQTRDRDKETTIERCDVSVDDGPGVKSRLIAKIICRNGTKS